MVDTVENVEEFLPPEALDNVNLDIPNEYELEIMASNMAQYLTEHKSTMVGLRAARHNGDNERTSQLAKAEAFYRNAIAYIQYKYPDAKVVSDAIMKTQAKSMVANRAKSLEK